MCFGCRGPVVSLRSTTGYWLSCLRHAGWFPARPGPRIFSPASTNPPAVPPVDNQTIPPLSLPRKKLQSAEAYRYAGGLITTVGRKITICETESRSIRMIKRIIPAPRTCFMLALILVVVASAMATTTFVLRKRVDDLGNVMLGSTWRPMYELDQWASFWNGWPSNIPWVAAQFFLILGIVLWFRGKSYDGKMSRRGSKRIAQLAGQGDGDKPPN